MDLCREKYVLKGHIACYVVFLSKKICSRGLVVISSPSNDGKIGLYSTSSRKVRCQSSCECTQCWKLINEGHPSMNETCFVIESISDAFGLFFTLICISKLLEFICYLHNIIFTH
jgi:hypothetical protein